MVKEINSQELQDKLAANKAIHLLDIRSASEVVGGVLPRSSHLPMHLISLKINELSPDEEIVLYCRSGIRSHHACRYLIEQGFGNVLNLRGGIMDWIRNGYPLVSHG